MHACANLLIYWPRVSRCGNHAWAEVTRPCADERLSLCARVCVRTCVLEASGVRAGASFIFPTHPFYSLRLVINVPSLRCQCTCVVRCVMWLSGHSGKSASMTKAPPFLLFLLLGIYVSNDFPFLLNHCSFRVLIQVGSSELTFCR